ncbi:Gcn2p kinase activity positive regulator [Komagataella phaffii CBS 7435]|uniref:eIF-2-alpha kinase activator GCN1 n=2 Tax=Komagataella phaffii TaxID=460519 RepID=C4R7J5_KOMPG|nr:Positive regulator of the Gcn2p kinase activity, forms a complex with Gcn20p [Komagataella phaffii GS115]AOA64745.1 GQ67_04666T0 [Komagataella phaffii]CAH2451056.1 Gcn2p kinase activity positive regulator [Komagataella phaffii CBS 7435]AOA70112.1 GQ68_04638T0 [Komagataella phaffii GS115]CAY71570.1 Positive regulator of the Gcn2p kinase activity, forms a complex with Gcn20p [Komagataella phaffii GS115]CCA40825.1 Gcn2p kinase activity positive regulator [Komagataella phaffii CBS 7435]
MTELVSSLSWDQLSGSLDENLSASSTRVRISTLKRLTQLLPSDIPQEDIAIIFSKLLNSYYYYQDSKSRNAVVDSLRTILSTNPDYYLPIFTQFVFNIVRNEKISIALTDLLTLLDWSNTLLVFISQFPDVFAQYHVVILRCIANTFEMISRDTEESSILPLNKSSRHKRRILDSSVTQLKTSFAQSFSASPVDSYRYLDSLISVLISDKTFSPTSVLLCIGLITESATQLLPTHPAVYENLKNNKPEIITYLTSQVFASKTPISPSTLLFFKSFFHEFVGVEDLTNDILPSFEKAILKSSENTLGHIAPLLFSNVQDSVNLIAYLSKNKLLSQLITNLKSSKEIVRTGSLSTFKVVLSKHSGSAESSPDLLVVVNELFKGLKSVSSADLKETFASLIYSVPDDSEVVTTAILENLSTVIFKDQNEVSLTALLLAFFKHLFAALNRGLNVKKYADVEKGFSEKKLNLRRCWFTALGWTMININKNTVSSQLVAFIEENLPLLVNTTKETIDTALASIAAKAIESAYVVIALPSIVKDWKNSESLIKSLENFGLAKLALTEASEKKPSVLLSSRIYSKFTTTSENYWFLKALVSVLSFIDEETSRPYGHAWLYLTCSALVPNEIHIQAVEIINTIYKSSPKLFAKVVIQAIDDVLESDLKDDDPLKLNISKASALVNSIILPVDTLSHEDLQINCYNTLILSYHERIKIKNGWVGLTQRASLDPGLIVDKHAEIIVERLLNSLLSNINRGDNASAKMMVVAISRSISTISFISPSKATPLLVQFIQESVNPLLLENLDSQRLEIWNSPEGELVVDVLSQSKSKIEDRNTKDYETRKWEESVKAELAKKKTASKKLSKEEQAIVSEQLRVESQIRKEVQALYTKISSGLTVISNLSAIATTVDNGKDLWLPVAVQSILSILKTEEVYILLGSQPVDTFLELSSVVSDRLGATKTAAALALLRSYKIKLEDDYLKEDLAQLVSRVLFKIKFVSIQSPLDISSLMFIIPLLAKVLENGSTVAIKNSQKVISQANFEFVEEDTEEEQLLLAIELISIHSELFEDELIPRSSILEVLLSLLSVPSKRKTARSCLLSLVQHIALNISDSDLKILLKGCLSPLSFVRGTILECFDSEFDLSPQKYLPEIWICTFDNDPNNVELASTIWDENDFELTEDSPLSLLPYLGNEDAGIRLSVAKSIAAATSNFCDSNPHVVNTVVEKLIELYEIKLQPPAPKLDEYGLPIRTSKVQKDTWEERSGVALSLTQLTPVITDSKLISHLFEFLTKGGALADKEPVVGEELLDAGVQIIQMHGFENIETLAPIFEEVLAEKVDKTSKAQGKTKESTTILYGALARHLTAADPRLDQIVQRLLDTLDTPVQQVQRAVSQCLAPLVPLFDTKLSGYIDALLTKLFDAPNLAERKGAAYGIAGLVKGKGVCALADYDILRTLVDAAEDKKDWKRRQGVSLAFECLSQALGKFFEPYVIEVLPIILKNLGDSQTEVREATDAATKVIMKNTTSFGVKKLIPLAIENLDEIAWRSKKGSVELLGAMAYLDPAQLSASLSIIVPEIVGVLNDSHKEVRKAADQALRRFGEVIRNPEIQKLVPTLLKAIGDPTKYTEEALDSLIKTQFVHYIDGPSLALIIHIISRGMKGRSGATKRKACQIVGNMSILVDSSDLLPYLQTLISELESAMVDPVPTTRATAARALGSLVEKLGEECFPDLIPRLMNTLQDPTKAGDRLGSAQALAEVINGLGIGKLDEILPEILQKSMDSREHIRAGFIPLLLFLPVCFGNQFAPYLGSVIPAILNGLADDNEEIQETSLRAGRLIIKNYSNKAVDLLLPELERGMSDISYRIRLSSVQLTGDLLFQVTGISGKTEINDDQVELTKQVNRNLVANLGQERRDRVLAALFICRSDTSAAVRNASVDIWKSLVSHTPRTIKEILPVLTGIIVKHIASSEEVQRKIAAQTLGETVKRVGGNALAQLLPTLEDSLVSGDTGMKQGICIALYELIESSSKDTIEEFKDVFVRIIRSALMDANPLVRQAAAQAFDVLQESIGKRAVDEVVPHLLRMLESDDDSEDALVALKEIMSTKSEVVFPILLPTLLSEPMDTFKANALGSLAEVAGATLYNRLSVILNALINGLMDDSIDPETKKSIETAFDRVLASVNSESGLHPLMQHLLSLVKNGDKLKRVLVFGRLPAFFKSTTLDYSVYTEDIVVYGIHMLDNEDDELVKDAWTTLHEIVKHQSKESLQNLVKPAQRALSTTGVKGQLLKAFALPKGPSCILPIFSQGLMYGSPEQRELSALAIGDISEKTPAKELKSFVTVMVGPLIRVVGERFSSDVKAAILYALNVLLAKIPQFLKPFIPQLQRTFVKSLSDVSNETLRTRAALALGTLIEFQPRIDPLVSELVTNAKSAKDDGVVTAMLKALLEVVSKAGNKISTASKDLVMKLVEEELSAANNKLAVTYACLVGSLSKILSNEEASSIIQSKILSNVQAWNSGNVEITHDEESLKFAVLTLNAFLKDSPWTIFETGYIQKVVPVAILLSNHPSPYISDNGTMALGKLLLLLDETREGYSTFEIPPAELREIVAQLCTLSTNPPSHSPDTRRLALVVIRTASRHKHEQVIVPNLDLLIPSIFKCVRDPIIPIKLAAEKAFLEVLRLVQDPEMTLMHSWAEKAKEESDVSAVSPQQIRSVTEYTRRVGSRLASVERDRLEAGGDAETMFSDRFEDESEIWAVGGVSLQNDSVL